MANIKISALTTYTGSATDIRWFVMNNSGNTETFKYSGYSSQLIPGSGSNSYQTINATNAGGQNSIAIGVNANARTGNNCIVIGNSDITNSNNPPDNIVIGRNSTTAGFTGGIVIGDGSSAGGNIRRAVAIGEKVSALASGICVGYNGNANGDGACAIGILNTATNESSTSVGVLVNCTGYHAVGIGRDVTSSGIRAIAIGRGANVSRENSTSVGGNSNTINGGTVQSIFGGTSNTISSSNNRNTIINGTSCQITGTSSGATYLGLNSYTNANINDCVYLDNLQILRTPSTTVQSQITGTTFTYNLNSGAKAQFYMTGASTVDITNVRDGASFLLKTITDGGHAITWTATGYTFKWKGGSSTPGNNKTDLWRFEVFGTEIFGELISDFS